ncbi:MAG: sigma factor-like helix-turn-helix DNA-binding protein [Marvinbryantia sp.]|uniref:sigma factor-like helix-turn-helix DNA-binding protein n=1 Tax=Marvinbryantia sp. TaxID=2496532 RepID=UPI0025FB3E8F|nr:sigma factor-like helix-turn-helix DNA-binding protein [uncultured Marvinbryantia sp.]
MEMTRDKLKQYRALKKEIASLDKAIDKLQDRAIDIPTVIGKVKGSSHDFPYIEEHFSVQMDEPREADMISRRMQIRQQRKEECEKLALEIEQFVREIPDSTDRQIIEMVFLEGMRLQDAGENVGYTKGRVSQKISAILKD